MDLKIGEILLFSLWLFIMYFLKSKIDFYFDEKRKKININAKRPHLQGVFYVVTTINIEFQDAAELALKKKLEETNAVWGSVVLMEVKTGRVKAIANLHRGKDSTYFDSKNHAIITPIAPGSTFKLINGLIALQEGSITKYTNISCKNNGYSYSKDKYIGCHQHLSEEDIQRIELAIKESLEACR